MCTVGRFVTTNAEGTKEQEITIFNTHLDDQSDKQRQLAASLLLQKAHHGILKTNTPIFVLGDFNRDVMFLPDCGVSASLINLHISVHRKDPTQLHTRFLLVENRPSRFP